ncbi:MAG: hypothetical protein QOF60_3486 [Actinomycetota bacterium]|jgi:hypothetical protein|nr:hypothetical protein [Actinomycetota bacterium]
MRRVGAILVAMVGVVLGVLVPKLAFADAYGGACHAMNGTSSYEFNGHLVVQGVGEGKFRVYEYGGQFDGADPEHPERIPTDAKNDFQMDLLAAIGEQTVYGEHTPDNIPFGVPYTARPIGWSLHQNVSYFGRFGAAFDKRYTEDSHCSADTPSFFQPSTPQPDPPPAACEPPSPVDCNRIFD